MRKERLFLSDKLLLEILNGKRDFFCQTFSNKNLEDLRRESATYSNDRMVIYQVDRETVTIEVAQYGLHQVVALPMTYEFIGRYINPKYLDYKDLAGYKNKAKVWAELIPYAVEIKDIRCGRLQDFESQSHCDKEEWQLNPYVFCYTIELVGNRETEVVRIKPPKQSKNPKQESKFIAGYNYGLDEARRLNFTSIFERVVLGRNRYGHVDILIPGDIYVVDVDFMQGFLKRVFDIHGAGVVQQKVRTVSLDVVNPSFRDKTVLEALRLLNNQ
jgi:hypothetical protein